MNCNLKYTLVIVSLVLYGSLFAQDTELEKPEFKNSFLLNFGYTHIPGSSEHGSEHESEHGGDVFVPAIGLDYGREISERWELLLMLDFELGKYLVRDKSLNRENAFMVLGGAAFKLLESVHVIGGLGIEFEKNENLFVTRLGGEYIYDLGSQWALMAGAYWDHKEDYSTYSLVVGVGYRF